MFLQVPDRQTLGVHPDQVVAVIESINAPNVALPVHGTGATKAYIVGVRFPSGTFTVFIYMHMLDAGAVTIFAHEPFEVSLTDYPALEGSAIHFAESMGFMLDNLNFRARLPEDQANLVSTLPFFRDGPPPAERAPGFHSKSSSTTPPVASATHDAQAGAQAQALAPLARLLGSF
jgi:hypothetical protein